MPDLIWRAQVTGSRSFPASSGIVVWALGEALKEAVTGGAAEMLVTHGDADGADRQADTWAKLTAKAYAAGRAPILVRPDPHPVDSATWAARCPYCAPPDERGVKPPRHRRRYHRSRVTTYCPEAGHRRNSVMVVKPPPARRGLAFFAEGLPNSGTLDCALKIYRANIPLWCFCDACGTVILPDSAPCQRHSLPQVTGWWFDRIERLPS